LSYTGIKSVAIGHAQRENVGVPLYKNAMTRVSTYLNFHRNTEEVFQFYRSVFGTEFSSPISRFGDIPSGDQMPPVAEADKNLVMHVALPILGGHEIMGSDVPESMGFQVKGGNNVYINLEPDTRAETRRLFDALKQGGQVTMELQEMFWGDYKEGR